MDKLAVKVFPGAQNLPLYAGLHLGLFERHGIALDLRFTRDSVELRNELADGTVDLVHTAVDNAVAMHEQGAPITVFMGGDSSMNEFFVQPRIATFDDLRGETLIVDAPDTAYALQAQRILADRGLRAGTDYRVLPVGGTLQREQAMLAHPEYAASIMNPPFSVRGRARGLKSLGRVVDLIGAYQATCGFARRDWFGRHGALVERYIAAYLAALAWSLDGANGDTCVALLSGRLDLDETLARATYALLCEPGFGFTPQARLDREGFRNLLGMRAALGYPSAPGAPDETRYVDLSRYEAALKY